MKEKLGMLQDEDFYLLHLYLHNKTAIPQFGFLTTLLRSCNLYDYFDNYIFS